ncbi:MAG: molybdopterin converting factor subunit 1 [Burkholderiaceae bacterium]
MRVELLFFAGLREALGTAGETVELPHAMTAGELREWLCARGGVWAETLAGDRSLQVAVARRMADARTLIAEGDEVAFFPPVTGG